MRVLFIADSLEKINPAVDSTLFLVRDSLKRGFETCWAIDNAIECFGNQVKVRAHQIQEARPGTLPKLGHFDFRHLRDFDVVFIRKDPPFDSSYVQLCWMLALEESRVNILNLPSHLLRYHEKLIPLEALSSGDIENSDLILTHVGSTASSLQFLLEHQIKKVITKPFLGHGGQRVELDPLEEWRQKHELRGGNHNDYIVQPFLENVMIQGDRRVFFLEGRQVGHFRRVPAAGGFISNLAQGGRAVKESLTEDEATVISKLEKFLKRTGIFFAGADLIEARVSEVNITSPTGLKSFLELEGFDLSSQIMESALKRIKTKRA